ncbi:uncharacterized protein LOC133185621 [Saccostrea echinata]|uniref:uncharacterized protein LOC133185621 n=1 Tax=Saccostrea echinata TaxID=191078 RepID=UPI002A7FFF30|nr:uncharacterized protein LOC133185621 [Saccostrea echinata]
MEMRTLCGIIDRRKGLLTQASEVVKEVIWTKNMKTSIFSITFAIIGWTVLLQRVSRCREVSQCAGKEISLDCSSPDWLIQVDYEIYGYNQSQNCVVSGDICTDTEFLNPPSVKYCNGRPSCTFTVPTDQYMTVCKENATSLKVIYQCVAKSQSFDMCSDFLEMYRSTFYLTSPLYPVPKISPVRCSCDITGENMDVRTLEQTKASLSPVVYILATDTSTKHITKLSIINRLEFANISSLEVLLDNRYPQQEFRLWLKLTGNGMAIKCGSPVIPSAVSSSQIDMSTHDSYLPSSIFSTSSLELFSSYDDINVTALPNSTLNFNINTSSESMIAVKSYLSSSTVDTVLTVSVITEKSYLPLSTVDSVLTKSITEKSYLSLSIVNSVLQTATVTVSSVSITGKSSQRISQSGEVILIAVIASVCGLFFIIFIVATILICRKKNEDVSESRENIHRPGRNVIDAYEQNDFTVNF